MYRALLVSSLLGLLNFGDGLGDETEPMGDAAWDAGLTRPLATVDLYLAWTSRKCVKEICKEDCLKT